MIVAHEFGDAVAAADGTLVRRAAFRVRSKLPLSACRSIAVGVGQRLSALLGVGADVELIAPCVPSAAARRVLFEDAHVVRARGQRSDVYAVVRAPDAGSFVARAFGERANPARPLSEMERSVLDRIAANVLALCGSLCGPLGAISRERSDASAIECASYFEVRSLGAADAALGFAFTRDPEEPVQANVGWNDVRETRCTVRVEVARGRLPTGALATLRVGSIIPLTTRLEEHGLLNIGGRTIGEGTCGEADGRAAFLVGAGEAVA